MAASKALTTPTVLITAFEPYGDWSSNSSLLALDELLRRPPANCHLTSRVWPVDFDFVKAHLPLELAENFDYVLHLGQAPGAATIRLEAIGLNVACDRITAGDCPLCDDGPLAYRSSLPLGQWAAKINAAGIPAEVSFHAGTYLCNAALYLAHYYIERGGLSTQAAFIHLPFDPSQTAGQPIETPSLPATQSAAAVRAILESL
jgi:pyroglutamyl-peptidase